MVVNYEKGIEHGLTTCFYKNGKKESEVNYQDGKKHKFACYWDENGKLIKTEYYENGKLKASQLI